MSKVRFATVRDLYDAFPSAANDVGKPASETPSLAFLEECGGKDHAAALSFCAYLLPRRVAVSWGCRSLRRMLSRPEADADKALMFTEAWVAEPEDQPRRKALAFGNQADTRKPSTWLALAAGWSGGSIMPPEYGPVSAGPEQTARAVRAAMLIAVSALPRPAVDTIVSACVEDGIRLARGDAGS